MEAKETSSNCQKFVQRFGRYVYELEAIPPEQLQEILRRTIDQVLDVDAFNAEIEAEKRDAVQLEAVRRVVCERLGEIRLQ